MTMIGEEGKGRRYTSLLALQWLQHDTREFDELEMQADSNVQATLTDGMKILYPEKPTVVNKEPGSIKLGDLPAKTEITDSMKKKTQFLDVIVDHQGPLT